MAYIHEQLQQLQEQVNGARMYVDHLFDQVQQLKEAVAGLPPDDSYWPHPNRPKRFTVHPSKALTNPELVPLLSYADLIGIPYELLPSGDRVYYLETLMEAHETLLTNAGITIETLTP